MADIAQNPNALRMVKCYFCGASNFVPPEYPPGSQMPCTKCAKDILVAFMLRHFEVRQVIASGGMGTVYRAYDTVLQRQVAAKLMNPTLAADPKKLDEFYREAKVIAALNHPHIIQVFHFGEIEGQNFIAMELADQGSLEDRINKNGRVTELEVLDVGIKVGAALGYALEKDLLHRDLKPANILYNAAGEPKLVDWGLAVTTENATAWGSGEIWGTPEYVAPEKVRREAETFHADMYSLGATLYQALTGRVPFECASVQETVDAHVHQPVVPPNELVPEISQGTSDAVVKMLAKRPRERFATYDEMSMVLTSCRSQLLVGGLAGDDTAGVNRRASAAGSAVEVGAPSKKSGLLVGVVVLLLAAAGAAAWFFYLRPQPWAVAEAPPAAPTNAPVETNVAEAANAPALKRLPVIPHPQITTPFLNLADVNATNLWRAWGESKEFPDGTWKAQNGILSVAGTGGMMIVVKERYIDFELSFEWKASEETKAALIFGLNEGIENPVGNAYRIPLLGGNESALPGGANGPEATGAFAGLLGLTANKVLRPAGQYNHLRLIAFKNRVEVWLNYQKVNEVTITSPKFKNAIANSPAPAEIPYLGRTTSGYVGFQPSPGFAVRSIRIRAIAEMPLLSKKTDPTKPKAKKKKQPPPQ